MSGRPLNLHPAHVCVAIWLWSLVSLVALGWIAHVRGEASA